MEEKPGERLSDIIFGIRYSVTKAEELVSQELNDNDYSLEAKETYPITRDSGDRKRAYLFKDYAPKAFASIRKLLGVSAKKFLKSWGMPDDDSELSESTARSGSMFYTTTDCRYLFKTILHPEVKVMMEILRDYHKHLQTHPKTFIVRIYGLFRYMSGTSKIWILIMGHSFPPSLSIKEKYDLKGRKPKPGKSIKERNLRVGLDPKDKLSAAPHKDNEIERFISFVEEHKAFYKRQLFDDIELLKQHDIMDYSLLIGIHEVTDEEFEVVCSLSAQDEVYFSGLPLEIRDQILRHDTYIKIKSEQQQKKKKRATKELPIVANASERKSPRPKSVIKVSSESNEDKPSRNSTDSDLPKKAKTKPKFASDNNGRKKKSQQNSESEPSNNNELKVEIKAPSRRVKSIQIPHSVEIDSEPLDPIPEIKIDSTERKGRKPERKSSDKKKSSNQIKRNQH